MVILAPLVFIAAILPGFTLLGAWRMRGLRGYGLAIAAAILAIIMPFGIFGGAIMGVWVLAVLLRGEVRSAFDGGKARRRRGGLLIAGGILTGVFALLVAFFAIAHIFYGEWNVGYNLSGGKMAIEGHGEASAPSEGEQPEDSPKPPASTPDAGSEIERSAP